jgi:hypothetical protein
MFKLKPKKNYVKVVLEFRRNLLVLTYEDTILVFCMAIIPITLIILVHYIAQSEDLIAN